jgi:predicted negative regulator of RcsB-dependent stress response
MYEKFLELKKNKKWLFYLLIIPFLIVAALEFYNRYLVNSGKKIVEDSEKKDEKLKAEQERAEKEAEKHKEKAEKLEEKIENTNIDENWHLDD